MSNKNDLYHFLLIMSLFKKSYILFSRQVWKCLSTLKFLPILVRGHRRTKMVLCNFWKLLEKYKIEIPIIQRDYAQGRTDTKTESIRKKFLETLIEAIKNEEKSITLDFVYGSIKDKTLLPLDGQQRLTTLFLLHWYIAYTAEKLNEVKDRLKKFSYETRISSREFCENLVENGNKLGEGDKISEKIKDSSWFIKMWEQDPTIKGMLVMLDAIEEKLKKITDWEKLWEKLTSQKNPPVKFYFLKLENFGLSDDLYIKMNARGKLLTPFENFKAKFEKYIKEKGWENEVKKPQYKFSHKMDTKWTDLFWQFRDTNNQIDNKLMKYLSGIAMFCIANSKKDNEKIGELHNNPERLELEYFQTEKDFKYLVETLDLYSKWYEVKPEKLTLWEHSENKNENTLFKIFIEEGTTYSQRILFYAQTKYLLQNEENFNAEKFSEWMRVIRNIVHNNTISKENFVSAINLINKLSEGSNDIYEYLGKLDEKEITFAKEQTNEEILKAKIINNSPEMKQAIFKLEDFEYLKGKIRNFIFGSEENNTDKELMQFAANHIEEIFQQEDHLIIRALLTIGSYVPKGWKYFTLGAKNYWDEILKTKDNRFATHKYGYQFFSNFFQKVREAIKNNNSVKEALQKVINNWTEEQILKKISSDREWWEYYFIKHPEMLKTRDHLMKNNKGWTETNGKYKYFWRKGSVEIELLRMSNSRSYYLSPFIYTIWAKFTGNTEINNIKLEYNFNRYSWNRSFLRFLYNNEFLGTTWMEDEGWCIEIHNYAYKDLITNIAKEVANNKSIKIENNNEGTAIWLKNIEPHHDRIEIMLEFLKRLDAKLP